MADRASLTSNRISSADSAPQVESALKVAAFPRGCCSAPGGAVSCIVTIDLDQYDHLPPRQLKAMLRALRFADEGGVVHASLTMLATPGLSRSTAHRELAGLRRRGTSRASSGPRAGSCGESAGGFDAGNHQERFRDGTSPLILAAVPAVGTPARQTLMPAS